MRDFIGTKIRTRKKIHPEFREIVRLTRSVFLQAKGEIDAEEARGVNLELLIEKYYQSLENAQTQFLRETDRVATHFSDEEHILHKDFLRDQLGPLFFAAPLNDRALIKPLGYAGDFEMMNMLYDDYPFEGPSHYFKIANALTCRCVSGRATASRIPYFLNKLDAVGRITLSMRDIFRVLDLACGPSKDICKFIREYPVSAQSEIHLVDQDPKAIEHSKQKIHEVIKETGRAVSCHFYDQPIKDLLTNPTASWPQFDLIYSGGLFDYLDDAIFGMALSVLFEFLGEGGTLCIGNLSPDDYAKTVKWYLDDWPLIYRTKDDLLRLASPLADSGKISIESDQTGVNLFLIAEK